jgi:choice-of-anchor C domain-containing protein
MQWSSRWLANMLMPAVSIVWSAGAVQSELINRSFESGSDPGEMSVLSPGSTAIEGWTIVGGDVWYVGKRWQPALGARSVGLPCGAGITQTIETSVDQEYEVRFSLAGDPTTPPGVKTLTLSFGTEQRTFTIDTTGRSFGAMGWEARFWIFTAIEPTATLSFSSPKANCATAAVDNVRITPVEIGVRRHPSTVEDAEDAEFPVWFLRPWRPRR